MASAFTTRAFNIQFIQSVKTICQPPHLGKSIRPLFRLRPSLFSSSIQIEDPNIVRSHLPDISIPETSLYDIVWETGITKHGNKVALVSTGCIASRRLFFVELIYVLQYT